MRMNRFSSAVLIGIVLCTSGNHRSFAAGNGDANENIVSTPTPEEAAIQAAAYRARLAARAAADAGFFLGMRGDFNAARKKFSQAIELDPKFSPAYRLRAAACMKTSDWSGAIETSPKFSMSAGSCVASSVSCAARGMTSTVASHSDQIARSLMGIEPKLSTCSAMTAR